MTWKEYEQFVNNYFRDRFPSANIEHNVSKVGISSNTNRQIDILVNQHICGYSIEIAIECKNWKKKLDVADVEQFVSKLNDLKITKGAMVSQKGYTKAAKRLANSHGHIQLHVLKTEELDAFTGFWGNPYNGNVGSILFPPNGWILDSKIPGNFIGSTLCIMHPCEISMIESLETKECILFNFLYISAKEESNYQMEEKLKEILNQQEKDTRLFDVSAKFKYWDKSIAKGKVKFRQIEYSNYTEVGGFMYTSYCIVFVCGICRAELINQFLDHIHFIFSELLIIVIKNVDINNSHDAWIRFMMDYSAKGEIHHAMFR